MKAQSMFIAAAGALLAGFLGGCGGPSAPDDGELGRRCDVNLLGVRVCDPGLVCDNNTCFTCGGPGERCCSLNTCNGGNECRMIDGDNICGDCGELGEACCPSDLGDSCTSGARCNADTYTCEPFFTDPCTGSTPRRYWGRYASTCSHPDTIWADVSVDDEATARECARAFLGDAIEVREEPPTLFDTCERSPFFVCENQQRWAFSEEDAASCAQFLCGTDCDVEVNVCPEDGTGICE